MKGFGTEEEQGLTWVSKAAGRTGRTYGQEPGEEEACAQAKAVRGGAL